MQIDYYYTLMSPWAYLGAPRFYDLQKKYSFIINHLPLDILKLFLLSGGEPLAKRAVQRKAYRMMELKRWKKKLNMEIVLSPKFFPPSDIVKASTMIMSIEDQHKQNEFSFLLLKQMWVDEKDVGEDKNIKQICDSLDLDFISLNEKAHNKIDFFNSLHEKAAKSNVFGSPTYVVDNEVFWGQDRLELLEEYIQNNL